MNARSQYFRFTKQTGTGLQSIAIGFRPKLVICWSTRQITTGPTDKAELLFGMTDGTNQVCNFIHHPDNEAATTSSQVQRLDRFVYLVNATSGATPTVEVEGTAGVYDAGLTINWTTNDGAARPGGHRAGRRREWRDVEFFGRAGVRGASAVHRVCPDDH